MHLTQFSYGAQCMVCLLLKADLVNWIWVCQVADLPGS